jgi:hypothetical protein
MRGGTTPKFTLALLRVESFVCCDVFFFPAFRSWRIAGVWPWPKISNVFLQIKVVLAEFLIGRAKYQPGAAMQWRLVFR